MPVQVTPLHVVSSRHLFNLIKSIIIFPYDIIVSWVIDADP